MGRNNSISFSFSDYVKKKPFREVLPWIGGDLQTLRDMFVIDFEVEDFEYTYTYEIESNYLVDLGMDGFITHELLGNSTNWQDSISYWNQDSLSSGQPQWTYNMSRLPGDDSQTLRLVKSDGYLTLSNGAWITSVDISSGQMIENYACHVTENDQVTLGLPVGDSFSSCDLAVIVESGVPNECAAAAACPPKDNISCSFAITSSIFCKASFLSLDSEPKIIANRFKNIKAIIKATGIA